VAQARDVLNAQDYSNWRNVRAAAWFFIIFGGLFALSAIAFFTDDRPPSENDPPLWFKIACPIVGAAGFVGGIATLRGNRRLAPLVYGMAFLYLFVFPLGTIVAVVMLRGLPRYMRSVDLVKVVTVEGEPLPDTAHAEGAVDQDAYRAGGSRPQ
jgi:hypothetical protein